MTLPSVSVAIMLVSRAPAMMLALSALETLARRDSSASCATTWWTIGATRSATADQSIARGQSFEV